MQASKTFYKLFLETKYLDNKTSKRKMQIIWDKVKAENKVLLPKTEVEIEKQVLGHPLPWRHRRANNGILNNRWIIESFLNEDAERESMQELSVSVKNIAREIYESLSPEAKLKVDKFW